MNQLDTCPCCGHILVMHKAGGCYGDNLACACPLDLYGAHWAHSLTSGECADDGGIDAAGACAELAEAS